MFVLENTWTAVRFKADNPGVWILHCESHSAACLSSGRLKPQGRAFRLLDSPYRCRALTTTVTRFPLLFLTAPTTVRRSLALQATWSPTLTLA